MEGECKNEVFRYFLLPVSMNSFYRSADKAISSEEKLNLNIFYMITGRKNPKL